MSGPIGYGTLALTAVAVIYATVRRGADARWVLALAATVLCVLAGTLDPVRNALPIGSGGGVSYRTLSAWLVTICGFGFAEVLRASSAPLALGRLIRRTAGGTASRHLYVVVPIGVTSSFVASMLLLSANSACLVVGPILVPILRSFGVTSAWAGACVVAGAWGAVLSVGDGNVAVIESSLRKCRNSPTYDVGSNLIPAMLGIAVVVAVLLLTKPPIRSTASAGGASQAELTAVAHPTRRSWWWLLGTMLCFPVLSVTVSGQHLLLARNLGFALMFVACATMTVVVDRIAVEQASAAFRRGVRKAVVGVIVLILASKYLAASVELYLDPLVLLRDLPGNAGGVVIALSFATAVLAAVCGSGDAAVAFMVGLLIPALDASGAADPIRVASLLWISGEMGRCVSPGAAATQAVAGLEGVLAADVARKALLPVCAGLLAAGAWMASSLGREDLPQDTGSTETPRTENQNAMPKPVPF